MNFFEMIREEFGVSRTEKLLKKMEAVIPWDVLEKKLWDKREKGKGGRGRSIERQNELSKIYRNKNRKRYTR